MDAYEALENVRDIWGRGELHKNIPNYKQRNDNYNSWDYAIKNTTGAHRPPHLARDLGILPKSKQNSYGLGEPSSLKTLPREPPPFYNNIANKKVNDNYTKAI